MPNKSLSPDDYRVIELGTRHVTEEEKNDFRPDPMALLSEVSKLFSVYLRQNERENLRQSRRMLLFFLRRHDGCVQQDMVKDTHLSPPAVSNELCEMERDGLILRRRDASDARAVRIHITEKGVALTEEEKARFRRLSGEAMAALSAEETEVLYASLYKTRAKLLNELKEQATNEKMV